MALNNNQFGPKNTPPENEPEYIKKTLPDGRNISIILPVNASFVAIDLGIDNTTQHTLRASLEKADGVWYITPAYSGPVVHPLRRGGIPVEHGNQWDKESMRTIGRTGDFIIGENDASFSRELLGVYLNDQNNLEITHLRSTPDKARSKPREVGFLIRVESTHAVETVLHVPEQPSIDPNALIVNDKGKGHVETQDRAIVERLNWGGRKGLAIAIMDGSGGSLMHTYPHLKQEEQDRIIGGQAQIFADAAMPVLRDVRVESVQTALVASHRSLNQYKAYAAGLVGRILDEDRGYYLQAANTADCLVYRYKTEPYHMKRGYNTKAGTPGNYNIQQLLRPNNVAQDLLSAGALGSEEFDQHIGSARPHEALGSTLKPKSNTQEVNMPIDEDEMLIWATDGVTSSILLSDREDLTGEALQAHDLIHAELTDIANGFVSTWRELYAAQHRIVSILRAAGEKDDITLMIIPPKKYLNILA
jgi:hypothetical protein